MVEDCVGELCLGLFFRIVVQVVEVENDCVAQFVRDQQTCILQISNT